jgi:tetratricopeptide (TPR) repeat protein
LIRLYLAAALLLPTARAAQQGQLDASPSIFSVMAAINVAGYDAEIDSRSNHPFREFLRRELASKDIPCREELKQFFAAHRQKDWTAELSQYVSFALSVDGPPNFGYQFIQNEIPPDVLPLEGLPLLMKRFHQEARIDDLWRRAQPEFDRMVAVYHTPVTQAVTEVNAYLRHATGYLGRRFQIYVDILGAPNQIQIRSYKDDYYIVLTPSPEPLVEDVRHAYLHFILDPLATKFASKLDQKKALIDFAQAAPALEDYYKSDFLLLATESLIKAVESRLLKGSAEKKQAVVEQALREGFILAPFFAGHLPVYEKQEVAMRLYFPDMIAAIDLKGEDRRLAGVEFASERAVRKAKVVPAERKVEPAGPYKTAEEAEQLYASRELGRAREMYLRLLKETDQKPLHAKAYYGLARIATLQKDPETAVQLFEKSLANSPDPWTMAWSLVYLGRLSDLAGEREEAAMRYRAALEVDGASDGAREAARQGLAEAFGKPQ